MTVFEFAKFEITFLSFSLRRNSIFRNVREVWRQVAVLCCWNFVCTGDTFNAVIRRSWSLLVVGIQIFAGIFALIMFCLFSVSGCFLRCRFCSSRGSLFFVGVFETKRFFPWSLNFVFAPLVRTYKLDRRCCV